MITHSVANELWSARRPAAVTRLYLESAAEAARELDPTLPISVDINGRPYHPEQFTYHEFDMLGINQYFGWYGGCRTSTTCRSTYRRCAICIRSSRS